MDINWQNISNIESYFDEILRGAVSDNVFAGELPPAIKDGWDRMVVIDVASKIYNENAYGQGIVLIWLYAKPLSSGNKNVRVLAEMEEALNTVIDTSRHPHYSLYREGTYQEYDKDRKLHANIAEIHILIK